MATNNRTTLLAADQKMVDGIQKHLGQLASVSIGSQPSTTTDMVKVFQDRIAAANAAVTAAAARAAAVKANRDKRAETSAFVSSLKHVVQGMFSQSPDTLADFGLKAPKAGKKTVAVLATAVAKSKATRAARHTMGSKQKEGVKGTIPGASPAPAPSPTAAPAPTASKVLA
jgi:hypothetical protein